MDMDDYAKIDHLTNKNNNVIGMFMEGPYCGCLAVVNADGTVSPTGCDFVGELIDQNFILISVTAKYPNDPQKIVTKLATAGTVRVGKPVNRLDKVLEIMGVKNDSSSPERT